MSRENWTVDKLLSRLINNKSDKSRWDNIAILRKRPSDELFNTCSDFTKSDEPKIRIIGINILAQLGLSQRPYLKQTLELFFDLLNSENHPEVLMSLLYAIGHNNTKLSADQIDKICSFASNDHRLVREGLVSALLGIDNLKAIETLIKLSSDKLSHIRNWATFGLGSQIERNNKNIREALWKRVNDKHEVTKLEAIVGLAKRKDDRVKEIIRDELISGEYSTLLFEAIIETQEKEFIPLLKQNLSALKGDKTNNPEWEKELKSCIQEMTELTKET